MEEELRNLIESKFQVPVVEGDDKTCTLEEAIRGRIKKGMVINVSASGALMYQLMREFWNKGAKFTFITQGLGAQLLALLKGGLSKKIVTSFTGTVYPSPGPNPVVHKAYLSREVELENWRLK